MITDDGEIAITWGRGGGATMVWRPRNRLRRVVALCGKGTAAATTTTVVGNGIYAATAARKAQECRGVLWQTILRDERMTRSAQRSIPSGRELGACCWQKKNEQGKQWQMGKKKKEAHFSSTGQPIIRQCFLFLALGCEVATSGRYTNQCVRPAIYCRQSFFFSLSTRERGDANGIFWGGGGSGVI